MPKIVATRLTRLFVLNWRPSFWVLKPPFLGYSHTDHHFRYFNQSGVVRRVCLDLVHLLLVGGGRDVGHADAAVHALLSEAQ